MRPLFPLATALSAFALLTTGRLARAEEGRAVPDTLPTLVLDTGRVAQEAPEDDLLRLTAHGEYQVRLQGMKSFLLTPSATRLIDRPIRPCFPKHFRSDSPPANPFSAIAAAGFIVVETTREDFSRVTRRLEKSCSRQVLATKRLATQLRPWPKIVVEIGHLVLYT